MKVFHHSSISPQVAEGGAIKTKVQWLITKEMGANNFAMRLFEIEPGGYSPLHTHPWEHEVFILSGEGKVSDGEKTFDFKSGYVVFVPSNELHQFRNTGVKALRFLCLIPYTEK